jgi:hypothetical protein
MRVLAPVSQDHDELEDDEVRDYCKLSDCVCVCVCAVLQVVQCSASVISEYYCQFLNSWILWIGG